MQPVSKILRRPPHPKSAILNALIYKNLRSIKTLSELTRELIYHPAIAQTCGFSKFPSKERFSAFLNDTPNESLQIIRESLVHKLMKSKSISLKYISVDSCPIESNIKENNLKTSVPNRFDKTRIPKGDPDARLGAYAIFPDNRKVRFFWGYRNHVINDASSELPVNEITFPANVYEQIVVIPQLQHIKKTFKKPVKAVMGDSAFDSSEIIGFIVKKLHAKPVIARNPRRSKNYNVKISSKGVPICIAGLEMVSRGIFYDKEQNRKRHKFICPIKARKKFALKIGWFCPLNHPKFFSNKLGCVTNLRLYTKSSIRDNIDYSSQNFKKLYKMRSSTERIFSRLLTLCMQEASVKGLNATRNTCTVAHITVLSVALACIKLGLKDKIRFLKTFLPNL